MNKHVTLDSAPPSEHTPTAGGLTPRVQDTVLRVLRPVRDRLASAPEPVRRRYPPLAVFAVALAYLCVSLGTSPYWFDEAASLAAIARPPGEVFEMLDVIDAVHGLYYVLLKAWCFVFGRDEWATRFPSAVVTAIAAALTYSLSRRLMPHGGQRTAITAAAILVLLPMVAGLAAEARPYALSMMLFTVVAYCVVRRVEGDGRYWGVAVAVVSILAVYASMYTALGVAAMCVYELVARRKFTVMTFVPYVVAAVVAAPLLREASGQVEQVSWLWWAETNYFNGIMTRQFYVRSLPTQLTGPYEVLFTWVTRATWLVALAGVWRMRSKASATMLLSWWLLPVALVLAVSLLWNPMHQGRYMVFTAPAFAMLFARALTVVIKPRWASVAVAGVVALAVVPLLVAQRMEVGKGAQDMRAVAERLQGADHVVYMTELATSVQYAYDVPMDDVWPRLVTKETNNTLLGGFLPYEPDDVPAEGTVAVVEHWWQPKKGEALVNSLRERGCDTKRYLKGREYPVWIATCPT